MNIPAAYRKAVYIGATVLAVLMVVGVVAIYLGALDAVKLNESIAAIFGVLSGIISGFAGVLALINLTPDK